MREAPQEQEGQYLLRVVDAIIDKVHEASYDYHIYEIEATYRGRGVWSLKPSSFQLLSDRGYKHSTVFTPSVRQRFPAVDLKDGESASGQIAFMPPKTEKPVKLVYEDVWRGISIQVTDLPAPSKEVSLVYTVEVHVESKHSFVPASGRWVRPDEPLYSGEAVEVEVAIRYERFRILGLGPSSITVSSIEVEPFELVGTEPKLPVQVENRGTATIKLLLRAPEKGHKGAIKVTVHA